MPRITDLTTKLYEVSYDVPHVEVSTYRCNASCIDEALIIAELYLNKYTNQWYYITGVYVINTKSEE